MPEQPVATLADVEIEYGASRKRVLLSCRNVAGGNRRVDRWWRECPGEVLADSICPDVYAINTFEMLGIASDDRFMFK